MAGHQSTPGDGPTGPPELDPERLLARIGLEEPPPADLEGLRRVHRAYVGRMPYETLAIHLEEVMPLDLERLAGRALTGGRGGYCFELNGVLGWLLTALGFTVERREARVGARDGDGPTNHLSLVVGVPGEDGRWLADAGLGEGWIDPLPLQPGVHATPGRLGWTVEALPDDAWWIGHHPWGSFAGVTITAPDVTLDAFAPHHRRLSCDPDSSFMGALVVQRPYEDRVVTLRARTLGVRGPAVDERRLLTDRDDLARTLDDAFGIDPATLGADRIERLWKRVCAQHEAWLHARVGA